MLLFLFLAAPSALAQDADNDGFTPPEDCNDSDPSTHPFAEEVCDGEDNNCDGETDEGLLRTYWLDADGDGYGDDETEVQACSMPAGHVLNDQDCDDGDADLSPAMEELCDGEDNNCNNEVDEGCGDEDEEQQEDEEPFPWEDSGEPPEEEEEPREDTGSTPDGDTGAQEADPGRTPKGGIELEIGVDQGCGGSAWLALPLLAGFRRRNR